MMQMLANLLAVACVLDPALGLGIPGVLSAVSRTGRQPRARALFLFKNPFESFENPFDDRPGAAVGKLQVALSNSDMESSRFLADAARSLGDSPSPRALAKFVGDVATGLCRRSDAWMYASCESRTFNGDAVEKSEHERYFNRLVNVEAAKFEKEYVPTREELERPGDAARGMCVVSLVVALENTAMAELFDRAATSERAMTEALRDLAAAALVRNGEELLNAEILWTPSSPDEALFRDEMLLDFPELLAL